MPNKNQVKNREIIALRKKVESLALQLDAARRRESASRLRAYRLRRSWVRRMVARVTRIA